MEKPIIILQGITIDELLDRIEERQIARDNKRESPLSKNDIGERLGLTYKTVMKIMGEMNLTEVYPSDINRILLKYPKYIKKANRE